jgi:hypothetical protein
MLTGRYVITFEPRRGVNAVHAIRRLLKHAGRYLGLRVVDVHEQHADDNLQPLRTGQSGALPVEPIITR